MSAPEPGEGPLLPGFYAGRAVLITGGTGFLGKVLIERLLYTCPEVGEVHLLLRDKRGQPPRVRLNQLKQSQAFDNVRAQCPGQLDKLRVVCGDVAQPRLGLDDAALQQLREVSVVFHSAATVKFWESLETALHQNVTSVVALMDLCDQLPKLEALVHVSTAYSNAERRHIEERVYEAPAQLAGLRAMLDALPPSLLDDLTARYIAPKPNTYVFSKAVAEATIAQRPRKHYATAIVRPSIVVSSHRHPFPGWIENLAGPSGVVVGCGKGLVHAFNLDLAARADLIPVDITIDTMLAVAWEIATDKSGEVRVYNSCSQQNPITWRAFRDRVVRNVRAHPFDHLMYYPFTFGIKNRYVYKTLELVLQTVPLHVADYLARLCGVKLQLSLVTVSERLQAMNRVLAFFATREWYFSTRNVHALRRRLTRADRDIYNLDVCSVDWDEHVRDFVKGTRKFLLKEKDDNIPRARRFVERLRRVHQFVLLVLSVLVYRFLTLLLPRFLFRSAPALAGLAAPH
ncbi:putative fatty acyl-CoA reductase CG5065 [Spodoptera frugiperda]|uniref:Fatty acyl-CoA reductase n=1 Tax=Spodoptera frugiperda TaxID=7108 RepID=A0A9R0F2J2_SPOFR|nr:putative fatty acyl-CoA reductase CG5065 [Spodoptera frugiperda]